MKYIKKNPEPKELRDWKRKQKGDKRNYQNLKKTPEKDIVYDSLLQEQGYLCCYCCKRVTKEKSHIEHLILQSQSHDDLTVDYNNLLVSCGYYDQEQKKSRWTKHCRHKKDDQLI